MLRWLMKLYAELRLWIDCLAPSPPITKPILSAGETVVMIKYPVTVPAGTQADIAKTRVTTTVDGSDPSTVEISGNGGSIDITVPDGSSGSVVAQYIDRAGNASANSPEARFENASDTTPPDAPAGAPTLGAGESV